MTRVEPVPEAVRDAACTVVKRHLRIETAEEDADIAGHAAAAIRSFEAFAGAVAVRRQATISLEAVGGWQRLGVAPVAAVIAVTRAWVAVAHETRIDAGGRAAIRINDGGAAEVTLEAGRATGWGDLPEDVRHGIVRLAAHLATHRDRAEDALPASVAALWRPHRRMRLA